MNKIKSYLGTFSFAMLAILNFTQSEKSFVANSMASSGKCNSCASNCTCGCKGTSTSSTTTTSSDDGNYAYGQKLSSQQCPIKKINGGVAIVVGGVKIEPGGSYVVNGTKLDCTFYLLAKCDQSKITECHEIK